MKTIRDLVIAFILILGIYLLAQSCKHDIPQPIAFSPIDTTTHPIDTIHPIDTTPVVKDPCSPDSVYFQNRIWPLIVSHCAKSGCHDASSGNDVIFTGYNSVRAEVRPGNPSGSKLYQTLTASDPEDRMPPAGQTPLTSAEIQMISKWIQQGAKNNKCTDTTCNTAEFTYSKSIVPMLQTYCTGCHASSNPQGGVDLTTYSKVAVYAANGKLYNTVNHTSGSYFMPLGGNKLSNCQITKIKKWVDGGYPNN